MGVVFRAYDPRLDRKVALKLVRPDVDGATETLLREAQAQARLSNPNVITIYDVGSHQGQVYLAMELVEGTTASEWLVSRPRRWREVLRVFREAGQGLAAAHAAGLVHRDFKPSNVLVGSDGRVRVTDFGLARVMAEPEAAAEHPLGDPSRKILHAHLTATGTVRGTPSYMAPEQFQGAAADARSDLFAFCVSLYEALYGELPFSPLEPAEPAQLQEQVAARQVREAPAGRRVPTRLRRVLLKGLSPRPDDRPASMEHLLTALASDPVVKWGRRGVVVAALALVAALAAWQGARRGALVCRGAERKLIGVWDEGVKRNVRQRFLATGAPFAETAWTETARALDRYASRWTTMHQDACEATRLRGEQSEEVLSLRMSCLDQRREDLQALTTLLATADRPVVSRSVEATRSLTPLSRCADVVQFTMPVPLPEEPLQRQQVESLQRDASRATAMLIAGKYREVIQFTRPLVAHAREVGYRPVEAELTGLLGSALMLTGASEEAESTLKRAFMAAEAGRYDEIKVRTAITLSILMTRRFQRFAEAEHWSGIAAAALERMGHPGYLEMRRQNADGLALFWQGKYPEAKRELEGALTVGQQELGEEDPYVITVLSNTALPSGRMGRVDEAIAINRRVLALRQRILGSEHPDTAMSANNLGWTLALAGHTDEGLRYVQQALAVGERVYSHDSPELMFWLDSAARILAWQGRLDEALTYANWAVSLNNPEPCGGRAIALNARGEIRRLRHQYTAALEDFGRCPDAPLPESSAGLLGLGETYLDRRAARGDLLKAKEALERAQAVLAKMPNPNPEVKGRVLFALARACWEVGDDRRRALSLASEARQIFLDTTLPPLRERARQVDAWLRQRTKMISPADRESATAAH